MARLPRVSLKANGSSWCGPVAVSVLAGVDYETARRAIAAVRGRRNVTGTNLHEVATALRSFGFLVAPVRQRGECARRRQTLLDWSREQESNPLAWAPKLVSTTGHWLVAQVVDGSTTIWDSTTPAAGVAVEIYRGRRKRVAEVHAVYPPARPAEGVR